MMNFKIKILIACFTLIIASTASLVFTVQAQQKPKPDQSKRRPALIRDDKTQQNEAAEADEEVQPNPIKASKEYKIGLFYLKSKNYDAAIIRFRQAVKYKPDFTEAKWKFIETLERKEDWTNLLDFSKSYLKDPGMAAYKNKLEEMQGRAEKEVKNNPTVRKTKKDQIRIPNFKKD